jgi:hypothetical protein
MVKWIIKVFIPLEKHLFLSRKLAGPTNLNKCAMGPSRQRQQAMLSYTY